MRKLHLVLVALLAASLPVAFAASGVADLRFPQPRGLAPAVAFWTRVYTEIDTNTGFIHDDRRLNRVYDTLQLDPNASPAAQDAVILAAVKRYRQALRVLAKGKSKGLTKEERLVQRAWGKTTKATTFSAAAGRVRFQRGQANRFKAGIVRSAAWESDIEEILRKAGLPTGLAALPFVESSYNPDVWSHAGAAGLWQFIRPTGQRFMRIDPVVDERLDPLKSSVAAARLLQHNFAVLKSWPLAITAYNHGLSGIRQAVRETGSSDIEVIVERYRGPRFGFASRNFYTAFLAAHRIRKHTARYFGKIPRDAPPRNPIILTNAFYPADALTQALGMETDQLRQLNPTLKEAVWRGDKLVPQGFELRLPVDYQPADAVERLQRLALVAGYGGQKPDRTHSVDRGDSLSLIANRYNTTVNDLMTMNGLRNRHRIRAGQKLRVPGGAEPPRLTALPPEASIVQVAARSSEVQMPPALAAAPPAGGDAVIALVENADPEPADPGPVTAVDEAPSAPSDREPVDGLSPMTVELSQLMPAESSSEGDPQTQGTSVGNESNVGSTGETTALAEVAAGDSDGNTLPVEAQPMLSADPANYGIGADGAIEIQAAETLGHYAEWLDLRAGELRRLNRMRVGQPLVIGRRLKLDCTKVTAQEFERRRLAYHQSLQALYFAEYRIAGIKEHQVRDGDSLWSLATRDYAIPLWLLRQYNPDIDFDTVLPPGSTLSVPLVRQAAHTGGVPAEAPWPCERCGLQPSRASEATVAIPIPARTADACARVRCKPLGSG
jgi:membrane-bound lytic murein transglycosylase D